MRFHVDLEDEIRQAVERALAKYTQPPSLPRVSYSVAEAAEVTSLSPALLRNEIYAKKLRAVKIGTRTVILRDDLIAYLQSHTTERQHNGEA